jgi:hypothetical protein
VPESRLARNATLLWSQECGKGWGKATAPSAWQRARDGRAKKFWNPTRIIFACKREISCVVINITQSSPGDTSSLTCPCFPNSMCEICQVLGDTKRHQWIVDYIDTSPDNDKDYERCHQNSQPCVFLHSLQLPCQPTNQTRDSDKCCADYVKAVAPSGAMALDRDWGRNARAR